MVRGLLRKASELRAAAKAKTTGSTSKLTPERKAAILRAMARKAASMQPGAASAAPVHVHTHARPASASSAARTTGVKSIKRKRAQSFMRRDNETRDVPAILRNVTPVDTLFTTDLRVRTGTNSSGHPIFRNPTVRSSTLLKRAFAKLRTTSNPTVRADLKQIIKKVERLANPKWPGRAVKGPWSNKERFELPNGKRVNNPKFYGPVMPRGVRGLWEKRMRSAAAEKGARRMTPGMRSARSRKAAANMTEAARSARAKSAARTRKRRVRAQMWNDDVPVESKSAAAKRGLIKKAWQKLRKRVTTEAQALPYIQLIEDAGGKPPTARGLKTMINRNRKRAAASST